MRKLLLVAVVAATAILPLHASLATPGTPHKSYVCKYVGKPGVDERLQTGQNPIFVDNAALLGGPGETFVGQEFKDAHGRSIVIVANTLKLDPEPDVSDCPSPDVPDEPTAGLTQGDCDTSAFVTLVNPTDGTLTFVVNGDEVSVDAGDTVNVDVDFGHVTVTVGEETILDDTATAPEDCGSPVPPVIAPAAAITAATCDDTTVTVTLDNSASSDGTDEGGTAQFVITLNGEQIGDVMNVAAGSIASVEVGPLADGDTVQVLDGRDNSVLAETTASLDCQTINPPPGGGHNPPPGTPPTVTELPVTL